MNKKKARKGEKEINYKWSTELESQLVNVIV